MRRKYLLYLAAAAGICLLVTGCGGAQNPLEFTNATHPFLDGFWDGAAIVVAFGAEALAALNLIKDQGYGLFDPGQRSFAYDFGYFVGTGSFFYGVSRLLR
jgi:hypothetical protein